MPASDVLEELSDDILMGDSPDSALRRLMRRGMQGRFSGLDSLRSRLQQLRDEEQTRLNLAGPLEELRQRLDEILDRERSRLSFEPGEDARMREASLDALPPDVPGQIRELQDYRFMDPDAKRMFEELMEHLKEQVLGSYFRQLAQGMRNIDPEQLARFKDMIAELNGLLERRERGEDVQPAFEDFMQRYGDLFPERPRTLDELLEQMARRMAAMSRLLASLSDEQRAELQQLVDDVMQDMDLAFELDRLGANLSAAFPDAGWDEPGWGMGEDAMPMSATVDALERMHDQEELDRTLDGSYPGASWLEYRDLREQLTPRGARKMGERALTRVFERLTRDREGTHEARDPGGLAEPTGQTRPWSFGDHGRIDVQRTVFNAVTRGAASEGVVRLRPDDFELVEAEERTETATALLLDLSFSMPLRGHLVHAKKMALALHALIEGRYPHDTLYLIGFSDFARRLHPEELATPGFERTYGTNMQHAFMMAGRLLAQHPRAARQVIMVTDGEPTAHLEGEQAFFAWPPEPETIRLTLAEAVRLSRSGVTLNIFMLEDSEGLARFMERLAERTGGRVFLMDDRNVGEFVLRDYVRHRSH